MLSLVYDNISALDFRYDDPEITEIFSEKSFIREKLRVEWTFIETLYEFGLCSKEVFLEVFAACQDITAEEVYVEEAITKHDIRALVNCIQRRVSDEAKPFVHRGATSFDIIDTANAFRFTKGVEQVFIPALRKLLRAILFLTKKEAGTIQIGRTHGQHAVPITFGFAMAEYADRLGACIEKLQDLVLEIPGKFSGAVGAYNALSLIVDDPQDFEKTLLRKLNLETQGHSTQIVQPEPLMRLLFEVQIAAGIMANLARDMRNLQRSEIAEIGEAFASDQVGSSTMPQKQNPINFENIESMWKILLGRMTTVMMDQISEHQRDLTGSASGRTSVEIIAYAVSMAKRLAKTMEKMQVNIENMNKNFASQNGFVLAEALYILLAAHGHPNAHESVKQLTLCAHEAKITFDAAIMVDPVIQEYLDLMTPEQIAILQNPKLYTGLAEKKALEIYDKWEYLIK